MLFGVGRQDADTRQGHGTYAVGGRGQGHVWVVCVARPQGVEVLEHVIDRRVDKPILGGNGGLAITGSKIGGSDQADAQPHVPRRAYYGVREFGAFGIGTAPGTVMHVVELTDGRDPGHGKFGIGQARDCVQIVRVQPFDQPVHFIPPAPESTRAGRPALGPSAKRALEGVGMGCGHPGQDPAAIGVSNCGRVVPGIHGFNTCPFLITVCTGLLPKK